MQNCAVMQSPVHHLPIHTGRLLSSVGCQTEKDKRSLNGFNLRITISIKVCVSPKGETVASKASEIYMFVKFCPNQQKTTQIEQQELQ